MLSIESLKKRSKGTRSHARQHAGEKLFQCNNEDSHNRNTEMLRNKLKEIAPSEVSPKVDVACLKARERSKVLTCLTATFEGQDGHKRQATPGRRSNGLAALSSVYVLWPLETIMTKRKMIQ
ncbi:hypothetical protein PoB_005753100 [Plakobranchus ocellatus]|uniref:Uncharacterized protein n=1 Tax=Plakobranchus ocellatus TaxID=259542 RepID=A0AAV4CE46_9GAST|nr:hypothetical protein PoB_005753100 [Plakobranchus ocellatus]